MNQGLTNKELKAFRDLLIQANTEQILFLKKELEREIKKRNKVKKDG